MPDERLEKLGDYFVAFQIGDRYQITFEQFTVLHDQNMWEDYKRINKAIKCVGCEG